MKKDSLNARSSSVLGVIEHLKQSGIDILIYEPSITDLPESYGLIEKNNKKANELNIVKLSVQAVTATINRQIDTNNILQIPLATSKNISRTCRHHRLDKLFNYTGIKCQIIGPKRMSLNDSLPI